MTGDALLYWNTPIDLVRHCSISLFHLYPFHIALARSGP